MTSPKETIFPSDKSIRLACNQGVPVFAPSYRLVQWPCAFLLVSMSEYAIQYPFFSYVCSILGCLDVVVLIYLGVPALSPDFYVDTLVSCRDIVWHTIEPLLSAYLLSYHTISSFLLFDMSYMRSDTHPRFLPFDGIHLLVYRFDNMNMSLSYSSDTPFFINRQLTPSTLCP